MDKESSVLKRGGGGRCKQRGTVAKPMRACMCMYMCVYVCVHVCVYEGVYMPVCICVCVCCVRVVVYVFKNM